MRTKVFIGTSLDGFIARKDGDIDWLTAFANEEAVRSYEQFLSGIDAILIGKGTFEKVHTFSSWPYKHEVFILSNSLQQLPGNLGAKATLLSMKPNEVLNYLSSKGFSNIYIDGGKVIQDFLRADLIDELIISRVPILIGNGLPLFDYIDKDIRFVHMKTETYSNGLVRTYYERRRQ